MVKCLLYFERLMALRNMSRDERFTKLKNAIDLIDLNSVSGALSEFACQAYLRATPKDAVELLQLVIRNTSTSHDDKCQLYGQLIGHVSNVNYNHRQDPSKHPLKVLFIPENFNKAILAHLIIIKGVNFDHIMKNNTTNKTVTGSRDFYTFWRSVHQTHEKMQSMPLEDLQTKALYFINDAPKFLESIDQHTLSQGMQMIQEIEYTTVARVQRATAAAMAQGSDHNVIDISMSSPPRFRHHIIAPPKLQKKQQQATTIGESNTRPPAKRRLGF